MIAALYVATGGCYFGLPDVDPWDETRDARNYSGPHPVVAHPPCERWGKYYGGSPTTWPRLKLGDDKDCFAYALQSVQLFGGVLEHPAHSQAWKIFGLPKPEKEGGWVGNSQGASCHVEQAWYGFEARKATWLYAVAPNLPSLEWGRAPGNFVKIDDGFHSAAERRRAIRTGACQQLSKWKRKATPIPFRDLLLGIARECKP